MTTLTGLASVLRAAGLTVVELSGWQTRRRAGTFNPVGVMWHHTGSAANGRSATTILINGRSDLPGPLCQLSIDRQGVVYVIAAGRSNHAGKANARGTVAAGDGNSLYIGIEFQHSGTEPWPTAQYEAGIKTTAAILRSITKTSERTIAAHYETSQTGKWDPGDPNGVKFKDKRVLDMNKVRTRVASLLSGGDKPAAKASTGATRVSRANALIDRALVLYDAAVTDGKRSGTVKTQRDAIRAARKKMPAR